jgi:hypothetical protein
MKRTTIALGMALLACSCGTSDKASDANLSASSSDLTVDRKLDWLQGNWIGCEEQWLHEKAISSSLGGLVHGVCKVMDGDTMTLDDYFEITTSSGTVTLTFYKKTEVERVLQCTEADSRLVCNAPDGSFAVNVTLVRGSSRDEDVLSFVKRYSGKTTNLDMRRIGQTLVVPSCR